MPLVKGEKLSSILGIANLKDFKVHLAQIDSADPNKPEANPLMAFQTSRKFWQMWNDNAPPHPAQEYNRPYIIGLAQMERNKKNLWLFGCVFEVMGPGWTEPKGSPAGYRNKRLCYEIRSVALGKKHSGLLVAHYPYRRGNFRFNLEDIDDDLVFDRNLPRKAQKWSW